MRRTGLWLLAACFAWFIVHTGFGARALGGGGEVGNGGDLKTGEFKAWFADPQRVVTACIDVSPGFGLSASEIDAAIRGSFGRWVSYIRAKHLYEQRFGSDTALALAEKLVVHATCAGLEDVVFRLGRADGAVKRAIRGFSDPVSIARLSSYDVKKRWGRGWVWVRGSQTGGPYAFPDWKTPFALEAVLTHEWGHVFGNPHVPYTIMAEDFMDLLRASSIGYAISKLSGVASAPEYLAGLSAEMLSIDQQKELLFCPGCRHEYTGQDPFGDMARVFERLAGRAARGEVRCRATLEPWIGMAVLSCADFAGDFAWRIVPQPELTARTTSGLASFRRRGFDPVSRAETVRFVTPTAGAVVIGKLVSSTIASIPVVLKVNMDALHGLTIQTWEGDSVVNFFKARPPVPRGP